MTLRSLRPLVTLALIGGALVPAHAQTFDFESSTATFTSGGTARPGSLTSLVVTEASNTLTVTRQGGTRFDIVLNTGSIQSGKPAAWGNNSIDPFFATGNSGFIFSFSSPITDFSIDFGDYSLPDNDTLTITAFKDEAGAGANLGSQVVSQNVIFNGFQTVSFSDLSGFQSFVATSVSSVNGQNNSLFFDNITVTTVATSAPEPGTLALLAVGGTLVLAKRRRK
jgi:PEP-CTERM motif